MAGEQQKRGPKFSNTQREEVKALVAKLDRRGYSLWQVRDELERSNGINITNVQVSVYLKQLRAEYKAARLKERQDEVNTKIEQYREIRREAWLAYDRSMEDSHKLVEEYGTDSEAVGVEDYITSEVLLKKIVTKEGRLPDNSYLTTIMRTLEAERELLGLDECKPGLVTLEQALAVIAAIKDAVREVLEDHPDLWRAVAQRTAALAPLSVVDRHEVVA